MAERDPSKCRLDEHQMTTNLSNQSHPLFNTLLGVAVAVHPNAASKASIGIAGTLKRSVPSGPDAAAIRTRTAQSRIRISQRCGRDSCLTRQDASTTPVQVKNVRASCSKMRARI